jgi:hypothetical protein
VVSVVDDDDDDGVNWGRSKRAGSVEYDPPPYCFSVKQAGTASLEPMGLSSRSSRELRRGTGEGARECLTQVEDDAVVPGMGASSKGTLVGVFNIGGGGGGGASGGRRCKNSVLLLLLLPTLSLSVGSSRRGGGIRGDRVWRAAVALATLPVLGLLKDVAPSRRYDLQSAVISGDELAKIETMRGW